VILIDLLGCGVFITDLIEKVKKSGSLAYQTRYASLNGFTTESAAQL
jgi:hypothetical protein